MPNTRLVCQGFTNAAWLATPENSSYTKISFTSFSCTFNNTVIQSQAAMGFANSVNKIRRTKGPFIQDVPKIDLSIEFEIDRKLLSEIVKSIVEQRNGKFKVKFTDHATSMTWEFSECYMTSFSFSVSGDSILSVSLSFFVLIDEINYSWEDRTSKKYGEDKILPIKTQGEERAVIPYYDFSLKYRGEKINDVISFEFSMNQSVEPKYECSGTNKKFAPTTNHLLIGLPEFDFSYSAFIGGEEARVKYYDDYDKRENGEAHAFHKRYDDLNDDSVEIYIRKGGSSSDREKLFELTGCKEISAVPSSGSFPSISRKFIVDGVMKI